MSRKTKTPATEKTSAVYRSTQSKVSGATQSGARQASPAHLLWQALHAPETLTPADALILQQTAGNRAVQQIFGAMRNRADDPWSTQSNSAVRQPGGRHEETANSFASQKTNQPQALPPSLSPSTPVIQRRVEEQKPLQGKFESAQRRENKTGLPDDLKAGIESLSGVSLDDVKVHYHSPAPASLRALAYTQGTDIYVKAQEEKHLPHEAWHVVQQKQGRVRPTLQAKGLPVNDDKKLESEADVMGQKAKQFGSASLQARKIGGTEGVEKSGERPETSPTYPTIQLLTDDEVRAYMPRDPFEKGFSARHVVSTETDFTTAKAQARQRERNIAANTIVKMTKSDGLGELKIAIKNLSADDEKIVKSNTYLWGTKDSYQWKTAKRDRTITEGTSKHQFGMILVEKETSTPGVKEMEGIKITHYEKPL
jgi:hypothetical protein